MIVGFLRKAARIGMVAGTVAVVGAGLVAPSAHADPAPLPTPVSANALPTWQINGVAWSQAIVGNTVYVVGNFTKARPPGVAVGGAGEVNAANIFAYNLTTGERVASFDHALNGQGLVVRAAPDNSVIYVGGDFSTVDGIARGHVAAFSTADGSLTSWAPNVGGQVRAFGITSDTVYVGGNFPSANGELRSSLAAFNRANSVMKPWAPTATGTGGYVWSMTMAPDNSRVIVGGSFSFLNGTDAYGMGSLDAATGGVLPWAATARIRTAGLNGAITSLKTDGTSIFGSGYAFGTGASFEGTFSADPYTGAINWVNDCLGDTYDTFTQNQVLYAVSHSHNCTAINEFPDTSPRSRWQKATAAPAFATGTITVKDAYGWDFRGLPYAGLLQWYPDLEFGSFTPDRQAAWSVTGSGNYITLAGEFPMVNGVAQQGLVRFANRGVAGPSQKPIYAAGMNPIATSTESGVVRVRWQATWDRDDEKLTYDVYRDNGPSIATFTQDSVFWNLPAMGFYDTGRTPGASHTYKIRVKDPDGNVQWSLASAPVTVSSAVVPAYLQTVRVDGASHLWRLGDTGPSIADSAQFADGSSTGVSFGVPGALGDNTAVSAAANSAKAYATGTEAHPVAVSVEAWVKTTTTAGGRIVGFGDSVSGTSVNTDMVLYLANTGKVNFALNNGGWRGVQSNRAINDGQWHHVVATADAAGVSLFVDGRRVGRDQSPVTMATFVGSWRMFSDLTTGLPNKPTNAGLIGSIDEVAVYPAALTQAQAQGHYLASGRAANWAAAPVDAYGTAVSAGAPDLYWRLGDAGGATAADSSPSGQDGTISGGLTFGAAGAVSDNSAMGFNGSSALIVNKEVWNNPTSYSAELWFKTATTNGGKLIGFGNAASGLSSSYDRQVVLLNNGRLQFGAYTGVQNIAETTTSYNDNAWHHVVATQGADGMKLYVDAVLAASNPNTGAQSYVGYWRVGGDRTWGGTKSNYVNATLDEAAVYPRVLTQTEIEQHYAASGRLLPNKLPTAAFTHTEHFLGVSVDGSGSSDPDGTIADYAWSFGDGATANGATATHSYAAAGSYVVTLTVTDDRGGTATTSKTVAVVANQAPTASFTDTVSFLTLSVDGTASTDADGELTAYAWDFGDGATATGPTATHTYAAAGTYSVTLVVTDTGGATGLSARTVTVVANQAPTAAFTPTVNQMTVAVDASASSDPDGALASYAWDFGDGSTGTGATAEHTYVGEGGSYTVMLTVTDDNGATATTSSVVTVTAPPNQLPTASFTSSATFLAASVDGSGSSDPDGTIVGYAWDFGDGTTGTGATASHVYASSGNYQVTLTVTDNRGGTATATQTLDVVANQAPTASFTLSQTFLAVSVDGTGSTDPEGPIAAYTWSFGDGTNGSGPTATHTYAAAGTYDVTLTVTDGAGVTGTTTTSLTVAANPAYATDQFERSVAGGWGTADLGGAWTVTGTASRYSVSGGLAKVSLTAAGSGTTMLPSVSNTNTEVAVAVTTDKAPTGGGQYVSVIGRSVGTSDYRAKVRMAAGGAVTVWLVRTNNGVETVLSTTNVAGLSYLAGDVLRVRMQVTGTGPSTIVAKVWKQGTTEPATWLLTSSDNSANLQTAGSVGIYSYVSGSATNAPVVFGYDDLWVGPARP